MELGTIGTKSRETELLKIIPLLFFLLLLDSLTLTHPLFVASLLNLSSSLLLGRVPFGLVLVTVVFLLIVGVPGPSYLF